MNPTKNRLQFLPKIYFPVHHSSNSALAPPARFSTFPPPPTLLVFLFQIFINTSNMKVYIIHNRVGSVEDGGKIYNQSPDITQLQAGGDRDAIKG